METTITHQYKMDALKPLVLALTLSACSGVVSAADVLKTSGDQALLVQWLLSHNEGMQKFAQQAILLGASSETGGDFHSTKPARLSLTFPLDSAFDFARQMDELIAQMNSGAQVGWTSDDLRAAAEQAVGRQNDDSNSDLSVWARELAESVHGA